jgi:hypothetical protein
MHFSIAKGDSFVSGTLSSLLFNTINRDQLAETFFLFLDLLESVYLNTEDLKQPCCHV